MHTKSVRNFHLVLSWWSRVSDHVEMYVNCIDLRKIIYRFMTQNAPKHTKTSTKFVEIINFRYTCIHKHIVRI